MPRSANPVPQYFDSDNKILSGGKVFYFNAGTSTPKTTYSDELETIANPHPVILDAAGRLPNVFFTGTAKQVLKDLNGIQIWERDDVGAGEQASDFNTYNLNISYDVGDIVKFGGVFYISLQNSNQNNQPDSSDTFWTEIRFLEVYNANVDYALGVVVQTTGGDLWKGVNSPNQGNDPTTDDGTNWLKFITRGDIIGTVSQVGGLPTGAIIESSSNSDGRFIKYADGTLICTKDGAFCDAGSETIDFPHAFVGAGISVILTARTPLDLVTIDGNASLATFDMFAREITAGAPVSAFFNFIAIGRWF